MRILKPLQPGIGRLERPLSAEEAEALARQAAELDVTVNTLVGAGGP
ncbi:hypothetical protein [Streptomyces sp. NBC_00019]